MRRPIPTRNHTNVRIDKERLLNLLCGKLGKIPDNLIVTDHAGEIIAFGEAAEQIFGYRSVDIIGKNVCLLMPEPNSSQHDQYLVNYMKSGQRKAIGRGRLVEGRRANGSIVPVELHIGEIYISGQKLFVAYTRDAATQHSTQRLVDRIDTEFENFTRLSAVGSMAGGMAHELNQPLDAISNYIDIAIDQLEKQALAKTTDARNILARARSQVFRAAGIVQKIRNYVSSGTMDVQSVYLNTIIDDAVSSARLSFGSNAPKIVLGPSPKLILVMADPLQISQVILNLLNNAREALEGTENPCITVSSKIVGSDTASIRISDNGPGIPPEIQGSLFNAFASTKPHGMGMGLSIAHAILYAHGKSIRLAPEAGPGATFEIFLDLADPKEVK